SIDEPEKTPQHCVRDGARGLNLVPALSETGKVLSELVDGIHRRDRLFRELHSGFAVAARLSQIEAGRIELTACDAATNRERDRSGKSIVKRLFTQVLVERVQGVALKKVRLLVRPKLRHRGVVLVIRERLRHVGETPASQVEPPSEVYVFE